MASAGIFYSLMVLSLLAPVVLYIVSYMGAVQTQGEQMTVKFEGIELANYADSIALDVPRVLDIASRRAIIAVIDYTDTNGFAVNDSEAEIKHLILYRNFTSGLDAPIMLNVSFYDWMNATQIIGDDHGFVTNLTLGQLSVNHSSPSMLNVTIEIRANITDRTGDMKLSRAYNGTALISVEGFTDPLYPLNTRGFVEKTVKMANVTVNDSVTIKYATNNSFYMNSSDAPSFLERLQGCTWPQDAAHNCTGRYPGMGIESFVYLPEVAIHFDPNDPATYLVVKPNSTMIDHWYFNASLVPGCNVTGVTDPIGGQYDWFRLDYPHNSTYGVGPLYGCPP